MPSAPPAPVPEEKDDDNAFVVERFEVRLTRDARVQRVPFGRREPRLFREVDHSSEEELLREGSTEDPALPVPVGALR